jgi:hypothetical protein
LFFVSFRFPFCCDHGGGEDQSWFKTLVPCGRKNRSLADWGNLGLGLKLKILEETLEIDDDG